MPLVIFFQIFFVSFLINLLWEVCHSQLYKTCLDLPLKKYIPLIIKASLKDGLWITLFFLITVLIFNNPNILANYLQLSIFVVFCLIFSFADEKISLKLKRWEYSPSMPKILGVGATPLLELAATGILTLFYVFLFQYL